MSRQHKKKRQLENVKLNLAAMLDMAFQLLAFFILTFKPAPSEGQVDLRLPPPMPISVAKTTSTPGPDESNRDHIGDLKSLNISLTSCADGKLEHVNFMDVNLASLPAIEKRLHIELAKQGSIFERVQLQVDSRLQYEQLMQVVDICARAKLPNGLRLAKLSFVEMPTR